MLNSKCPPLAWAHAWCLPSHWSIVSSKIDCSRCIDELPFQFIHTVDLSVVDTILHDSPDVVIHRTKIWDVWRIQVAGMKVWRFLTQQFNCCTCAARCAGALSCWNTKSLPDTLRIVGSSMTSLWRREAASPDITRISCFVTTMKSPRALEISLTVFVKKCMWLHFSS